MHPPLHFYFPRNRHFHQHHHNGAANNPMTALSRVDTILSRIILSYTYSRLSFRLLYRFECLLLVSFCACVFVLMFSCLYHTFRLLPWLFLLFHPLTFHQTFSSTSFHFPFSLIHCCKGVSYAVLTWLLLVFRPLTFKQFYSSISL